MDSIIRRLCNITKTKSRHHQHRLACAIIKSGNILSFGWNHSRSHAEQVCLNRAFKSNVRGATMYVVRVRNDGKISMSKPCPSCMAAIIEAGIAKVVYSDNDGVMNTIKLHSAGYKLIPHTNIWGNAQVNMFSMAAVNDNPY